MKTVAIDRRRLPQPTIEDLHLPTSAIGLNNRLSGFSTQQQQQQLMSGGSPKRNQLPSVPTGLVFYNTVEDQKATRPLAGSPHIVHNIPQPVSFAGSRIALSSSDPPITTSASMFTSTYTSKAFETRRPFSPVSLFLFVSLCFSLFYLCSSSTFFLLQIFLFDVFGLLLSIRLPLLLLLSISF